LSVSTSSGFGERVFYALKGAHKTLIFETDAEHIAAKLHTEVEVAVTALIAVKAVVEV